MPVWVSGGGKGIHRRVEHFGSELSPCPPPSRQSITTWSVLTYTRIASRWQTQKPERYKRSSSRPPLPSRNSKRVSCLVRAWAVKAYASELSGIIEARQRLDSQQSENELVLKVHVLHYHSQLDAGPDGL